MADRESVITHLQIIHTWAKFARKRDLQFFTEKHLEDIAKWSDDAIELLEEQEPRILKPEEFAGTYSYCWLETKASDGRTGCRISDICVADDGVNYEAQFVGTSDRGKLPHDLLGSRWRCWSAEPTREQRKAVKWE